MLQEAEATAESGTEEQRRDLEHAQQAGTPAQESSPRKQRTASQRDPSRSAPAIGRNEIVTVVNPSNGESQQMKWKKAQPLLQEGWKLARD